jgi:hypothetical protein
MFHHGKDFNSSICLEEEEREEIDTIVVLPLYLFKILILLQLSGLIFLGGECHITNDCLNIRMSKESGHPSGDIGELVSNFFGKYLENEIDYAMNGYKFVGIEESTSQNDIGQSDSSSNKPSSREEMSIEDFEILQDILLGIFIFGLIKLSVSKDGIDPSAKMAFESTSENFDPLIDQGLKGEFKIIFKSNRFVRIRSLDFSIISNSGN